MSLIFLAFWCVASSVFLIFYLHFFLPLLLFFFFTISFFLGQQDVIKNWKSIPNSAKTWIKAWESEMSRGKPGAGKRGSRRQRCSLHVWRVSWVGWSQNAEPLALFPLSWLMLSASQGCMCVYVTHSFFWKLSLPRPLEGHLFSIYGIWMDSRGPKSSKHQRADHLTPTSPGFPTPPLVLPAHLPFILFCPLSIPS